MWNIILLVILKKYKVFRIMKMLNYHVIKELGCINCNHILSLNFRTNVVHRRFFLVLPIHQLHCNFCFHCSCENSMNANKKVLKIVICIKGNANYRESTFFCLLKDCKTRLFVCVISCGWSRIFPYFFIIYCVIYSKKFTEIQWIDMIKNIWVSGIL